MTVWLRVAGFKTTGPPGNVLKMAGWLTLDEYWTVSVVQSSL